ncbi:MAG: hypothetical protein R2860_01655 [Desulfobacterales bacterium]
MDASKFNYSAHVNLMPKNPHVPWARKIRWRRRGNLQFSKHYPHRSKKIYYIEKPEDAAKIDISPRRSQVVDFVIEGANHLDLLYGRLAEEIVKPLMMQIIEKTWNNWSYDEVREAETENTKMESSR